MCHFKGDIGSCISFKPFYCTSSFLFFWYLSLWQSKDWDSKCSFEKHYVFTNFYVCTAATWVQSAEVKCSMCMYKDILSAVSSTVFVSVALLGFQKIYMQYCHVNFYQIFVIYTLQLFLIFTNIKKISYLLVCLVGFLVNVFWGILKVFTVKLTEMLIESQHWSKWCFNQL